jgi:hypothetical protein
VERCGQWSGMSLMDPGNVERPAVNSQMEGWPVEWYLTDGPR